MVINSTDRYIFVKNLYGDVIEIRESNTGNLIYSYGYDAYGNLRSVPSGVAAINPFRYRGYYQDNETGYYYLKTRYYDPKMMGFISPDDPAILFLTAGDIGGTDLYAYCLNDPINYIDPNGQAVITALMVAVLVGAIVGGAIGGAIAYDIAKQNGEYGWRLAGWTTVGVLTGGLIGAGIGYLIGLTVPGTFGGMALAYGGVAGGVAITGSQIAAVGVISSLILFAFNNRPGNNQKQNEQFKKVMRELGIEKTNPKWRYAHESLHREPPMGFKELLEFIKSLFGL